MRILSAEGVDDISLARANAALADKDGLGARAVLDGVREIREGLDELDRVEYDAE